MKSKDSFDLDRSIVFNDIDLSYVPSSQQFNYFADGLCNVFSNHTVIQNCDRVGFPARIRSMNAGQTKLSYIESPSGLFTRNRKQVEQLDGRYIYLNYLLDGAVYFEGGGKNSHIMPGDFSSGQSIDPYRYELCNQHRNYKSISIIFSGPEFLQPDVIRGVLQEQRFMLHQLSPMLKMTMFQLSKCLEEDKKEASTRLLKIAESLILMIAQDEKDAGKTWRPSEQDIFNLVEKEIASCLRDHDLNLETVARRLGFSKRRIQRVLADKETTFTDTLRQKRLELGMELLQTGTLTYKSIAEVAYECGYSEQSSFHRAFKKQYGLTPGHVLKNKEADQDQIFTLKA